MTQTGKTAIRQARVPWRFVLFTVLLAMFAVLGWRMDGLAGAMLVPSIFSVGEMLIVIGLLKRR